MLPNVDPTTPSVAVGTGSQARRPEVDKVAEAYRVAKVNEQIQNDEAAGPRSPENTVRKAAGVRESNTRTIAQRAKDSAEINFQLTREEREVFVNALSGKEDPAEMTEQEQTILQRTAERIEKILDEANALDTENRERLDKAVKEWYTRLSNGKHEAPGDLLTLIRKAARSRFYPLAQ